MRVDRERRPQILDTLIAHDTDSAPEAANEYGRAPLLWILAPYLAGLAAGAAGSRVALSHLAVPGLALLIVAAVAARGASVRARAIWALGLGAVAFGCGVFQMQRVLQVPERWSSLPPREATLEVEVLRTFNRSEDGKRQSCLARVLTAPRLIDDLAGQRVFFTAPLAAGAPDLLRSQVLRIRGVLEPIGAGAGAGPGDFNQYLRSTGVPFKVSRVGVPVETRAAGAVPAFWAHLGARFARILEHGLPAGNPAAGAYLAMFLGRKSDLSPEQREDFLRSGLMHIFAISGLHIAVIAGCLTAVLGALRVPRGVACLVGLVLLTLFVEATGGSASARRSLIMVAFIWGGRSLRRPVSAIAALVAAALVVLVVDPLALLSASFQFSYSVVAALILYGGSLRDRWLARWRPWRWLAEEDWTWWQRRVYWSGRDVITATAMSCAATLASTPLSIAAFGLTSPGGLVSNLVLVPVTAYAISAGFFSLVSGLVGGLGLSGIFNHAGALILAVVDVGAHGAARVPGMYVEARFATTWAAPALELGLMAALVVGYATRWRWPRGALGLPPAALLVGLALLATRETVPPNHTTMKSAYELAMERLGKSDPDTGRKLTDEDKGRLAEIDRVYQGKIAEREIFLQQRLGEAHAKGDAEAAEQVRKQLGSERARLEEEREEEKNRVRHEARERG